MFKLIVVCAALAVANAGYLQPAAHAVSYSTYAAAPTPVRYAAAAPAYGYAAPAVSYATPVATTALVGQQSNILRSFGNLGTVSTYSKTLNTPFSSVVKSDVRVSNPGFRLTAPVATYAAAPAALTTYHGNGYGANVGYAAAAPVSYGHVGYAAAAPVSYGHVGYAAASPVSYGHVGYAAATPAVAHVSYTGNYGSYGW